MCSDIKTLGVRLLDIPYHLDIEYTYYVPETIAEEFAVGDFVLVPFGNGNKKLCALVTSTGTAKDYSRLKPVLSSINRPLSLNDEMMALVSFLCDRTLCTAGDAVRRLIPAGAFERADEYFIIVPREAGSPALNVKASAVLAFIAEHSPVTRRRLEKEFGPEIQPALKTLQTEGYIQADTRIKETGGAVEEIASLAEDADPSSLSKPRTPQSYRKILELLEENGPLPTSALIDAGYKPAHIKALVKRGFLKLTKNEVLRNSYRDLPLDRTERTLNEEQELAFRRLSALMDTEQAHAALLYGVTGSGKTSVILALCEKAVSEGKSAMVLVPEISLTRQTVSLFFSRFGEKTAVVHSGLSDGERFDTYKRIRRAEVSIVLGTRSAVFAPLSHIGLIVLDEEQEATYKSDMSPKYHARDVAKYRAFFHGALLVMASATPCVESYYEAKAGKYELVTLSKRYHGSALPSVTIADMRLSGQDPDEFIGQTLREEMRKTYESGKQSMLFLNRRGYHSLLSCRACGEALLCPNCSVSLTHHKTARGAQLICHYCGYRIPVPHFCPKCGSEHLAFAGYGTQRIEDEIASFLPEAKILRMDADTTKQRFSQDEITASFGRGDADILIGTQMIAKGHNFPNLSLVGVVAADNSLFLDDFRANERTFSLITQVIGRAGRAGGGGHAVIQTYNPENETIRLSAAQDYEAFYQNEIAVRRALVFPPFCDIAVFSFSADEETALRTFSADFAEAFKNKQTHGFEDVKFLMFGPFEAPVFKVRNKYRMRIVIKFKNNKRARALFAVMLSEYGKKAQGKIVLAVDINPTNT